MRDDCRSTAVSDVATSIRRAASLNTASRLLESYEGFGRLEDWQQKKAIQSAVQQLSKVLCNQPYPGSKYMEGIVTVPLASLEDLEMMLRRPISKINPKQHFEWQMGLQDVYQSPDIPEYCTEASPYLLFRNWTGRLLQRMGMDDRFAFQQVALERWVRMSFEERTFWYHQHWEMFWALDGQVHAWTHGDTSTRSWVKRQSFDYNLNHGIPFIERIDKLTLHLDRIISDDVSRRCVQESLKQDGWKYLEEMYLRVAYQLCDLIREDKSKFSTSCFVNIAKSQSATASMQEVNHQPRSQSALTIAEDRATQYERSQATKCAPTRALNDSLIKRSKSPRPIMNASRRD